MSHALVFWMQENKYSVVSIKSVMYGKDAFPNINDLVGSRCPVQWMKGQIYTGEIKAIGEKAEVKEHEAYWEKMAAEVSFNEQDVNNAVSENENEEGQSLFKKARVDPDQVSTLKTTVDETGVLNLNQTEFSDNFEDDHFIENQLMNDLSATDSMDNKSARIQELESQLLKTETKYAREVVKNKSLRRMVKNSKMKENNPDVVCIGDNVQISKGLDDFLKASFGTNPSVFFRRLLFEGGLFTLDEIAASSLTGMKTVHSPVAPRPALNPHKFNILKDYTIKCCNLKENTVDLLKFEKKLRSICTDARKKLKFRFNEIQ